MIDTRILSLLLCAAAACSSGNHNGGLDGGSADLSQLGSSTDLATSGSCTPSTTYGGGETSMAGAMVTAKIVDETGAPVAGQPVYLCGIDICGSPEMTGADGTVSIQTNLTMKKAAFKFGDAVNYAELAIPLTSATTDFTAAAGGKPLGTGKLSDKTGATLTPGADAISGDVTISVPAGDSVGIDGILYDTPDLQKLRTVKMPLTNEAPVLDPISTGPQPANFVLLYGVAPAETLLCPPAKVTVALPHSTKTPNDFGWQPGDGVEFWVMTVDTGQTYAPYAGWAKISDGVVSSDGGSISTVAGQGFTYLDDFAVRKKP